MLPAICARPWWWTKLSPWSASSAALTTYSCSAVRGAVSVCVAAGWRGRVSRQGTWGGSYAAQAATVPMVIAVVLPEPRGIPGKVPAGCRPGHRSAVCAVRFSPVGVAASPLLYGCGPSGRGALLQRLQALPRREGTLDRLRVALHAQALRVRVGQVLLAVLRGRPGQEEELVQVPVALVPWTGCAELTTVPPRLRGVRPRRVAAAPGGQGGGMWVCG